MNAEQIMDVRRRVYGEVNEAREELGELEARVGAIWADAARFTIDARTEDVAREIQNGRGRVEAHLQSAREIVDGAYAGVTGTLDTLRAVDPEDLRVRAAILAPTLASAPGEPPASSTCTASATASPRIAGSSRRPRWQRSTLGDRPTPTCFGTSGPPWSGSLP